MNEFGSFKYLGSVLQNNGGVNGMKWREASGVLCNRRIPIRLKGKFYKTAVLLRVVKAGDDVWIGMLGQNNEVENEYCGDENVKVDEWSDERGQNKK